VRYIDDLEACCRTLADDKVSGRPCDYISPGQRRMVRGKHVVFFRRVPGGILVSRILISCRQDTKAKGDISLSADAQRRSSE
jgi:plasmid stabilization system protein ParE